MQAIEGQGQPHDGEIALSVNSRADCQLQSIVR